MVVSPTLVVGAICLTRVGAMELSRVGATWVTVDRGIFDIRFSRSLVRRGASAAGGAPQPDATQSDECGGERSSNRPRGRAAKKRVQRPSSTSSKATRRRRARWQQTAARAHAAQPFRDAADFEVRGILERGSRVGNGRGDGLIVRRRTVHGQTLHAAAHGCIPAEASKPSLLRRRVRRGRPRVVGFQHRMKLLVRPVLLGMARGDAFGTMPKRIHQTAELRQAVPPRKRLARYRCESARATRTRETRARSGRASRQGVQQAHRTAAQID